MNTPKLARLILIPACIGIAGCQPSIDPAPMVVVTVEVAPEVVKTVEVVKEVQAAVTEIPAALPYISVPTPFPEFMTVVASGAVDVRSGPGETFTSYGQIAPGATAQVAGVSPDQNWYLIYISMDASPAGIGWVPTGMIWVENEMEITVIQPPPLALRMEIPKPATNAPQVVFQTDTAVRSGPGANYPIFGQAYVGTRAEATGIGPNGRWYVIKIPENYAPGGQGWVSASALSPENAGNLPAVQPPPVEEPLMVPPPLPDKNSLITIKNLRVRSGPGEDYPSYGLLWSGTRADFIGMSPDYNWYAIRMYIEDVPEGIGWVEAESTTAMVFQDVPIIELEQ